MPNIISGKDNLLKFILYPISRLYGMVTSVRNWLFDSGIIKEQEFDIPVVVVGNLAVGGTGKTPHVEYIVEHLRKSYHVAVVSRGYKRATKGFVMATPRSTPADIGDEPYQIYQKFNCEVKVAVDEDRVHCIRELLRIDPEINLVLLDDAFQHRYVKPTVSVLLTEYNRPLFKDELLPLGHLRESKNGAERADLVVVSKCPDNVSALNFRLFEDNMGLLPFQKLFFSKFKYGQLRPLFPESASDEIPSLNDFTDGEMVLAVAGIGNPKPFIKHIKRYRCGVKVNIYPDHHVFTRKDMETLRRRFLTMGGRNHYLITTEKDAVRLLNCPYFPYELLPYTYYLPVQIDFVRENSKDFVSEIESVITNKRMLKNISV